MLRLGEDGGADVVLAVDDAAVIDAFLRSAHLLDGWGKVDFYRRRLLARVQEAETNVAAQQDLADPRVPTDLRRLQAAAARRGQVTSLAYLAEARPALAAWQAASARFAPEVHAGLVQAETAAQALCAERITAAKVEVKNEAARYLTGFEDSIFTKDQLRFPDTTRLRTGKEVDSLRSGRAKLAMAEDEEAIDRLADSVIVAMAAAATPLAGVAVSRADIRNTAARAVVRAAQLDRLGALHPVLLRMGSVINTREPLPPEQEFQQSLVNALTSTWNAATTVGHRAAVTMVQSDDVRFTEGPSAALGQRLSAAGIKGGGGFFGRILGRPLGPWEYQAMVAEAVTDLVGPGPSATRQAVTDVYTAADPSLGGSFAETTATVSALATAHVIAPPLAVCVDVILALKGIAEHVSSFARDQDAYNCALDPADALGSSPSVVRLALECAGEVAGALPASKLTTLVSVVAPLSASLVE